MKSIAFAALCTALLAGLPALAQDANRTCRLAEGETRVDTLAPAINCIDGKADAAVYVASEQADTVNEMRRQLADMQIALGNLQQQVVAQTQAEAAFNAQALARIDMLERELAPFRVAKGAVLAFDRPGGPAGDGAAACPDGWSHFEPAGGRMIVGAGRHDNTDASDRPLTKYTALANDLTIDKSASTGGEERHLLTQAEMPSHAHGVGAFISDEPPVKFQSGGDREFITPAGGDQPHNNMPPYVALYYCTLE